MKKIKLPANKIAAVSDGDSKLFTEAFGELEKFSNKYIRGMLDIGGYPAVYPWPVDNLHNWSRWWEYSFVWFHLKPLMGKGVAVLDIGSALTFFPWFLANKGFEVTVVDIDGRVKGWAESVLEKLTCLDYSAKRRLKFVTGDIVKTKFRSSSFEVITNISVIEHIGDKRKVIKEIFRLLQSDGKLINTLDISLDGKPIGDSYPLLSKESYEFIRILEDVFGEEVRFEFTHPMDIVTPGRYPRSFTDGSLSTSRLHLIRQIWKMLGPRFSLKFLADPRRLDMWTVAGVAVRKKK